MAMLRSGERVARDATVMAGAPALILDETGGRALLTRRADNGRSRLPGGARSSPGAPYGDLCARGREESGPGAEVVRLCFCG